MNRPDVLVPTMPVSLVTKLLLAADEWRCMAMMPRNMLWQYFDVSEVGLNLGKLRLPEPWRPRLSIMDNGWAEGKHTTDPMVIEHARSLVGANVIVVDDDDEQDVMVTRDLMHAHRMYCTGCVFLVCLNTKDASTLERRIESMSELAYPIIWGIPKKLGPERTRMVEDVCHLLQDRSNEHVHLLGMSEDEDEDICSISRVPQNMKVTIDSTWPVYQALSRTNEAVKRHSHETWGILSREGRMMTENEGLDVLHALAKQTAFWNSVREQA